ncbi:hypothetical protein PSPO01_01659 [Paraphaeosphaeria sporulosa]
MDIFMHRNPPINSPEIEDFWRSLIEVVDALRGIHDFKTQNDGYHGLYNDIKPESIITMNDKHKLASPGFAKFKKTLEQDDGESLNKIIAQGRTTTYAAPERYARKSGEKMPVSQSFASIEFIQFGDDHTGTEQLRALDDGMEFKEYQNIIDHEMFSVKGDVRKMLLANFNPYMDESKKFVLLTKTLKLQRSSHRDTRCHMDHWIKLACMKIRKFLTDHH